MNLVSYEYVACQADNAGVLVLSEFAGAAQSLGAGTSGPCAHSSLSLCVCVLRRVVCVCVSRGLSAWVMTQGSARDDLMCVYVVSTYDNVLSLKADL